VGISCLKKPEQNPTYSTIVLLVEQILAYELVLTLFKSSKIDPLKYQAKSQI
jgi:hypothetical protein